MSILKLKTCQVCGKTWETSRSEGMCGPCRTIHVKRRRREDAISETFSHDYRDLLDPETLARLEAREQKSKNAV